MNFITSKTNQPTIEIQLIEERREAAIIEIAREFCWIYRDWQSAIGEEMIEKIEGAKRRFDIIGFSKFGDKYSSSEWLQRIGHLFANLDVSVDDKYDSRVSQLKKVFGSVVNMIVAFKPLLNDKDTIPESSLIELKKFSQRIRNN